MHLLPKHSNMKSDKPSSADAKDLTRQATSAKAEKAKPVDLGIAERRHFIRPLPVADVVESDRDTDWAAFQALNADKPESK